jgi:hypothetical protein
MSHIAANATSTGTMRLTMSVALLDDDDLQVFTQREYARPRHRVPA